MPLHAFSPGFSPQPPWPLHSLFPAHRWAAIVAQAPVPAQAFSPPAPAPLHWLRPRQTCFSPINRLAVSSAAGSPASSPSVAVVSLPSGAAPASGAGALAGAGSAPSSAQPAKVPATTPPNAAIESRLKSRRLRSVFFMSLSFMLKKQGSRPGEVQRARSNHFVSHRFSCGGRTSSVVYHTQPRIRIQLADSRFSSGSTLWWINDFR